MRYALFALVALFVLASTQQEGATEITPNAQKRAECSEYPAHARSCRGWEGRDNDACFSRIRREYAHCQL